MTLLHYVIAKGDLSSFKHILDREDFSADVANAKTKSGESPIQMVVKSGNFAFIQEIFNNPVLGRKFSLSDAGNQLILHRIVDKNCIKLWPDTINRYENNI